MKRTGLLCSVAALVLSHATLADAHTIGIGWLDNGDGSVTLFAEHWHGDQSSPSTANGGLGIYDGDGNFLYKTQWTSVINNEDLNGDGVAFSGAASTPAFSLTGYGADASNHAGYTWGTDDWLVSDALVLGNGTWGFFTGTSCCIDTMSDILYFDVTGITSVGEGTGPGDVPAVPLPAGLPLLAAGLGAFGLVGRRRKKA